MVKMNMNKFFIILLAAAIFTGIDYLFHNFIGGELLTVPANYYLNKFLISSIVLFILSMTKLGVFIGIIILTLILQVRYLSLGYTPAFHAYTLIGHYIILAILLRIKPFNQLLR